MWAERVFQKLVWLGQRVPAPLRIALTRLPMAAWLRQLSQMPRGGPVIVRLNGLLRGYRMRLDLRAGHRRFALGTYEPEIAALIQTTLQRGEIAMDIGANIGYFTLLMARQVGPAGRVIAFEPLPSVYAALCENLRLNDLHWAQAECRAVADHDGEARIWSEAGNPLSFTARLAEEGDLVVPTVSIDRYIEVADLARLDFVKIDVEGAEDAVIRGMTDTLQKIRPVVLLEIHANDGRESEGLRRLKEAGYKLMRAEKDGLLPCDTRTRREHVVGWWRS